MEAMKSATTSTDEAAVVATVLDYFEGWFDGDPARMERAKNRSGQVDVEEPGAGGAHQLGHLSAQRVTLTHVGRLTVVATGCRSEMLTTGRRFSPLEGSGRACELRLIEQTCWLSESPR